MVLHFALLCSTWLVLLVVGWFKVVLGVQLKSRTELYLGRYRKGSSKDKSVKPCKTAGFLVVTGPWKVESRNSELKQAESGS